MKLFFRCLCLVSLCICVSCGKHAEFAEYIPADATGVVSIDVRVLLEKSGSLDDDAVNINGELRRSIEDTGLRLLPVLFGDNGGKRALSIDGKAYFFTGSKTIDYAWLFAVDSDDVARATVEKLTGKKFDKTGGVPMIYDDGTLYAMLDDDALMIAHSGDSEDEARSAASEIANCKRGSLLEANADARKAIEGDAALCAYFKPEGLRTVLNALPRLVSTDILAQFDLMPLLAASGDGAITFTADVNAENIKISGELHGVAERRSLDAEASEALLKSIPAEMSRVTLFNVAGASQLPSALLASLDQTGVFDCVPRDSIVKHLTGPFAVATEFSPKNVHIEGPNYTVVATCDDVYKVFDMIFAYFVDELGQTEEGKNDELIFQLGARPVTIGLANDSVLYLNVLDFQRSGKKFGDDAARTEYMTKSYAATDAAIWRGRWNASVSCRIMPDNTLDASLTSNKNAVVALLGILCEAAHQSVAISNDYE